MVLTRFLYLIGLEIKYVNTYCLLELINFVLVKIVYMGLTILKKI